MLKHLRGKHDQRDHGRRAIGGGGGARATGLLPPEIQSQIAERKPFVLEAIQTVINSSYAPSRTTLQVADLLKGFVRGQQEEIKKLTRRYNDLRKSGGDLRKVQNDLLTAVIYHEAYREKHNEFLSIARAERKEAANARRRQRKPTPTPKGVSSESLDSVGLLGWVRQRPDNPPDYKDYDRETESFTQRPGAIRKLERTPENKPVRIIPDMSVLEETLDPSLPYDAYERARADLLRRASVVADTDVFKHQGESNEDFWKSGEGWTVATSVAAYASNDHKIINGTLRGREPDSPAANPNVRQWRNPATVEKEARKVRKVIKGLDDGMRPVPETVMSRRGIDNEVFQRMQEHLRVGDRFTDAAFVSTSVNPTFRWVTGENTMNVILTEGTPALWTDKRTQYSTEVEVIVGRGTTFEVVSMDAERGVILRTVLPDGEYTPPPLPPTP